MYFYKKLLEKKTILIRPENLYNLLVVFVIFLLDRLTKIEIIKEVNSNPFYINDYINLDLIWNTGIGFGLLSSDSSLIYNFITLIIGLVILVLIYLSFTSEKIEKIIYSIIIGGALGNFYDRCYYNAVPDFIDLHYNSFHWFTFNVADIFITMGVLAFIAREFFVRNKI